MRNAIDLAHAIGVEMPKVAILAAVETVSPTMAATLDRLTKRAEALLAEEIRMAD